MRTFLSKLLVIFIFGFLPAVSGYIAVGKLLEHGASSRVDRLGNRLRERLIRIADASSDESFYFTVFNRLFSTMRASSGNDDSSLSANIESVRRLCGGDVSVFRFDGNGEYLPIPRYAPPNRYIVGKIWDILAETAAYREGDEQRLQKKIQTLLGSEANAGGMKKSEGQPISLKKSGTSGYFYWRRFTPRSKAGIAIVAFPILKTHQILARLRGRTGPMGPGDLKLAYWSHDSNKPLFISGSEARFSIVRDSMEKSSVETLVENGRIWSHLTTVSGVFLASFPLGDAGKGVGHGMLNLLMTLVMGLLLMFLFRPEFDLKRIYLKIGNKLLAILLVAIAFPTVCLLLVGVIAIDAHERVLLTRLKKDQVVRLSAIEDDFRSESKVFAENCRALLGKSIESWSPESFAAHCASLMEAGEAVRIELRALDGEPLFIRDTGGWFAGLEKTQDAYSRHQINKTLSDRQKREGIPLKRPLDNFLSDAFETEGFGFERITRAPDTVHSYKVGLNEMFWYWSPIDVPGHPAAMLNIFQAKNLARARFLQRVVRRADPDLGILGAYDENRRQWLNPTITRLADVDAAMRAAILEGKPRMQTIAGKNRRYHALAFPGTVLSPFSMIVLTDERLIGDRIRAMHLSLALGMLAIFAVAIAIARLLTQAFLVPVLELDRGMQRLQQHRSDAAVSIEAGDEFGELGVSFNRMVEDLKEMNLAKTIQESLFPQQKQDIPGYGMGVFNLAATDLGGDYCDYVRIGPDRFLFLIGDVSGHGTSAALCMAMAKAAVFKAGREGLAFSEIPKTISSLLLRILRRKKMMTMLFVLLDTATGTLEMINAGHNWPVIVRRDGRLEEFKIIGLPLGVRESVKKEQVQTAVLEPGDFLFAYTDGLPECHDPKGNQFGHEAMYLELSKLAGLGPEKVIARMESVFRQFLAGGAQQDDMTILVVRRDHAVPERRSDDC
ncbi:MAG TPA: SpoIIE family protein phosphatase [Candidatus Ozemobacteraceae bacterium]|nr:SpoIIE family protein phosphatase [Candidatus Ozemobacteraceae bacterium]